MASRFEVFRGVLILGVVAAANVPTGQAQAQVHPGISRAQAVLTTISAWRHRHNLPTVGTGLDLAHHVLLLNPRSAQRRGAGAGEVAQTETASCSMRLERRPSSVQRGDGVNLPFS